MRLDRLTRVSDFKKNGYLFYQPGVFLRSILIRLNRLARGHAVSGMAFMTLMSRVLGLVRDQVQAYVLGTGLVSDAWRIGFQTPNLFRRMTAEGAMTPAFLPTFQEAKRDQSQELQSFLNNFFSYLVAITSLLTIAAIILAPYFCQLLLRPGQLIDSPYGHLLISFTRWMFPYIIFISLSALLQAVLNSHKDFMLSAATPIALNLVQIVGTLLIVFYADASFDLLVWTVLIGGFLQFIMQYPQIKKYGYHLKFQFFPVHPLTKIALKKLIPTLLGSSTYQINILLSNAIAFRIGPGIVSALYFSNRLIELTLGIFVISITTVSLPHLTELNREPEKYAEYLLNALSLALLVTLPAAIGLIYFPSEIISLLFEYGAFNKASSQITAYILAASALGLPFFGITRIFLSGYYSTGHIKFPAYVSVFTMVINVVLSFLLGFYSPYATISIPLASLFSSLLQVLLLGFYFNSITHLPFYRIAFLKRTFMLIVPVAVMYFVLISSNQLFLYLAKDINLGIKLKLALQLIFAGGLGLLVYTLIALRWYRQWRIKPN